VQVTVRQVLEDKCLFDRPIIRPIPENLGSPPQPSEGLFVNRAPPAVFSDFAVSVGPSPFQVPGVPKRNPLPDSAIGCLCAEKPKCVVDPGCEPSVAFCPVVPVIDANVISCLLHQAVKSSYDDWFASAAYDGRMSIVVHFAGSTLIGIQSSRCAAQFVRHASPRGKSQQLFLKQR
jgi:hypothetical protein